MLIFSQNLNFWTKLLFCQHFYFWSKFWFWSKFLFFVKISKIKKCKKTFEKSKFRQSTYNTESIFYEIKFQKSKISNQNLKKICKPHISKSWFIFKLNFVNFDENFREIPEKLTYILRQKFCNQSGGSPIDRIQNSNRKNDSFKKFHRY